MSGAGAEIHTMSNTLLVAQQVAKVRYWLSEEDGLVSAQTSPARFVLLRTSVVSTRCGARQVDGPSWGSLQVCQVKKVYCLFTAP